MRIFNLLVLICALVAPIYGMGRIVGGEETTIERRPYQASLQYYIPSWDVISHRCGGSIISTKFLLSAAHCNPGPTDINIFYARVGSTIYNEGGQLLKVASFRNHPLFNRPNLDYDFGILDFADGVEIQLGPKVAIIPLTENTDPIDGSLTTVSGWGVVRESDSRLPTNLREVDLPVVNQDVCKETYDNLTPRHLCLGGTEQGMLSACFGDSGGPVVQNGTQYALVSGRNSCELPKVPGKYNRISAAREWIREISGI